MKILQIGQNDWSKAYNLNDELEWFFLDPTAEGIFDANAVDIFLAVIVNSYCEIEVFNALEPLIITYSMLIDQSLQKEFNEQYDEFFKKKMVVFEDMTKPQELLDSLLKKFAGTQFGQRLPIRKILFSPIHDEKVWFEGTKYLCTNISYGDNFRQLLFWKLNIEYDNQTELKLWLEYKIEEGCSIALDIQFIQGGSPDTLLFHKRYNEEELSSPIVFTNDYNGYLICSVFVKGDGLVQIGPIHYRHSRLGAGEFIPGGERLVDSNRQEMFYYFNPGNLKPPFNIHFSDYRPKEGFDGYYMMRKLDHPFLLISDSRLEGGSFYVGSNELEDQLQEIIHQYIDFLEIEEEDIIFSGLSMGSLGALYYGSKFKALAIIVGKPIIDVEYVAKRTRLVRPDEFLTVLDIVKYWDKTDDQGNLVPLKEFQDEVIQQWSDGTGFGDTELLITRMEQDDYDDQAYYTLLKTQSGKETTIIAKGYQGRHNDQNSKIMDWFVSQYKRVIREYKVGRG